MANITIWNVLKKENIGVLTKTLNMLVKGNNSSWSQTLLKKHL